MTHFPLCYRTIQFFIGAKYRGLVTFLSYLYDAKGPEESALHCGIVEWFDHLLNSSLSNTDEIWSCEL